MGFKLIYSLSRMPARTGILEYMAASVLVPLEEYLATCYRPDKEYVDGELVERFVGEHDHSYLQVLISAFFASRQTDLKIRTFTEQRIRLLDAANENRYRIPDICVVRKPYQRERVLTHPPYLVVEILSPGDHTSETLRRVNDFASFGVTHIWIVEPAERKLFEADESGIRDIAGNCGQLPELGLTVDFNQFFQQLDED